MGAQMRKCNRHTNHCVAFLFERVVKSMAKIETKGDIISAVGIGLAVVYLIAQMIRALVIWL